jgi:hypothetical protein
MQMAKAGLLYVALVFGAGFVLGSIRILWVVPRLGTRIAKLMEMPIMFVLASRDSVSGTVYSVMLGVFAIMPLLVIRRSGTKVGLWSVGGCRSRNPVTVDNMRLPCSPGEGLRGDDVMREAGESPR